MKNRYINGMILYPRTIPIIPAIPSYPIYIHTLHSCQKKLIKTLRCRKIYRNWAKSVLEKYNYKCILCGLGGDNLQAHHKITLKELLIKNNLFNLKDAFECDELWDINNGECLCSICHIDVVHFPKKWTCQNEH